jgi:hypothetical protein
MSRSPKSIRHLLKGKPSLRLLELEISAQKALLASVKQALPVNLTAHCVAAQLRGPELVLHVDSPVWATRIRYLAPELLSQLQLDYPAAQTIRIRQLPPRSPRQTAVTPARHSDFAARIIHDSALDTKQPQLKAALERLSLAVKPKG